MSAALAALAARPGAGRRIAALGGMLELGDQAEALHRALGREAAASVDVLYGIGPQACVMIAAAREAGLADCEAFDNHADLAKRIHEIARPGDTLLLKGSRGFAMEKVLGHLSPFYETLESGR